MRAAIYARYSSELQNDRSVDGLTALQISLDPDHLQSTARAALQENTDDR